MIVKSRFIVASILLLSFTTSQTTMAQIRYLPFGDSYTICEGAKESERWPNILTLHLQEKGIDIELIGNPSVTGWTTQDLIDKELPLYRKEKPNFSTLLIGVNDWVQGVSKKDFRKNLSFIMDEMLEPLTSAERLIVITIPDFSVMPEGPKYSKGRDISAGLQEFNKIIKEEAAKRNLKVVDIFDLSQKAKDNPKLVGPDGLHPSAAEYANWEEVIFPVVYGVLK